MAPCPLPVSEFERAAFCQRRKTERVEKGQEK